MAKIIEREDQQASTEDVFAEQEQPEVEEQVTPSEPEIPENIKASLHRNLYRCTKKLRSSWGDKVLR